MNRYARLAFTNAVRRVQHEYGSDRAYNVLLQTRTEDPDVLGKREASFLASRDSFYLATVSETGWLYVQYRGGPPGFVHVLDEHAFLSLTSAATANTLPPATWSPMTGSRRSSWTTLGGPA